MSKQSEAKEKLAKVRRIIELKQEQIEKLRGLELIFLCEAGEWDMELESYMRSLHKPVPAMRRYDLTWLNRNVMIGRQHDCAAKAAHDRIKEILKEKARCRQ